MKYVCPMHPEVVSDKSGKCPKCGMALVKKEELSHEKDSYTLLLVIVGLILLTVGSVAIRDYYLGLFSLDTTMLNFMAGFFLVFAGFKLLDLKGFAAAYSTYDLLAQKVYSYGYSIRL